MVATVAMRFWGDPSQTDMHTIACVCVRAAEWIFLSRW